MSILRNIAFATIFSAISFGPTFAAEIANPESASDNLIRTALWRATTDDLGSSFQTGEELIEEGIAKVTFTIAVKEEEDEWPYVELICETGMDLSEVQGMEIVYRCTSPLIIKLSQSDFGYEGNQTYSHYEYTAPASEEWNTVQISISDFTQPDWAPEDSRAIPLKMENVPDIYLVPALDYTTGESGTVEVKSLLLYGAK
ncbi:hypothetical protein CHISP_0847 [Chitinispirillum alkaliphilum]|nr:hypothetical protein CHISP_0847 [Chitinispirillum alkaliphilum]